MLLTVAAVASSTTNSTSTVKSVEPGVLAFLIVAGIGLSLVFLLKSMNKQLRKIGPKPEDDAVPGTVSGEVLSRADTESAAGGLSPADARATADASTED